MRKMTYGQWLRAKRREMDLTQRDVETRTGAGLNALSKIENDRRRPMAETRKEIHRILGTSDKDLADLGILEEVGRSGRYDWPSSRASVHVDPSHRLTRFEALDQIRDAAGDMKWTQAMVDIVVAQVRLLRDMQDNNKDV